MLWDKDRVRQLRLGMKLTQNEMADLLGCRQQTISEWEQGLYAPANAYGKLLEQMEMSQSVVTTQFHNPNLPKAAPQKPKQEESENSFDKPFDPAID